MEQLRSVGAREFGRGKGETAWNSALLSSLSSAGSSRVAQPEAIERRSAIPSGIPAGAAGAPAGLGRVPLKLPQATQSIASQQTAPPTGESKPGASGASPATPNCASACGVASSSVLWLAPLGTSRGKVEVPITAPPAP